MKPIYLDYAATTPIDPRVAEQMCACLTLDGNFANPASRSHRLGWQAEQAVEQARGQLAKLLNADIREIVWTSGATESNNLALKGVVEAHRQRQPDAPLHIITSAIEHKAVLDTCAYLQQQHQVDVTYLAPDANGVIHADQVERALRDDTCVVSLMAINNELGSVNDLAAIGALLADHSALFHVDAAQAVGKTALDVKALGIDMLSVSAHKFYGPKGIGALFVRRDAKPQPLAQMHGGGHERGLRSGTLATHQVVGIGAAAEIAQQELAEEEPRIGALRDRLWAGLAQLGDVYRNGDAQHTSAQHLNVSFGGVDGEILLASLAKVALSSGSACNSATVAPSYVLKAIGVSDELAHAGLRFSLGRFTTEAEVDAVIDELARVLTLLRG